MPSTKWSMNIQREMILSMVFVQIGTAIENSNAGPLHCIIGYRGYLASAPYPIMPTLDC